jgi:hypothetical protein
VGLVQRVLALLNYWQLLVVEVVLAVVVVVVALFTIVNSPL